MIYIVFKFSGVALSESRFFALILFERGDGEKRFVGAFLVGGGRPARSVCRWNRFGHDKLRRFLRRSRRFGAKFGDFADSASGRGRRFGGTDDVAVVFLPFRRRADGADKPGTSRFLYEKGPSRRENRRRRGVRSRFWGDGARFFRFVGEILALSFGRRPNGEDFALVDRRGDGRPPLVAGRD